MDSLEPGRTTTIVIANTAETFKEYFVQGDLERNLPFVNQLGDRVLLWKGDQKVAITSLPVPHLQYWKTLFKFGSLVNLVPAHTSESLSFDMLHDERLLDDIVHTVEHSRIVEIIPYGTTPEFVSMTNELIRRLSNSTVEVSLPESPTADSLWLWKYFDSKAGFRQLIGEWFGDSLPARLPEGFVMQTIDEAVSAVQWFLANRKNCICKPSIGVGGVGQMRFYHDGPLTSKEYIEDQIGSAPYMIFTPIVVEELIHFDSSPSAEGNVSRSGKVQITYNCEQIISGDGHFDGAIIDRTILNKNVEQDMIICAMNIGTKLQRLGYVGTFDLDFVLGREDRLLYLLESNLRRTGATHAHEAATLLFGENYSQSHSVLCVHDVRLRHPQDWVELMDRLSPFLFPIGSREEGLILSKASSLPKSFGYVMFADSLERLGTLRAEMEATVV